MHTKSPNTHAVDHHEYVIMAPRPAAKKRIDVLNAGGNRGALANLQAFVDFNAKSHGTELVVTNADPVLGRSHALAARAATMGLTVIPVQARFEDIAATAPAGPLIGNLDKPSGLLALLKTGLRQGRAVLAYLIVRLPSGRLWGWMFAIAAGDDAGFAQAIMLVERLVGLTERGGSSGFFGATAEPASVLLEEPMRAAFARHTALNLAKIAASIELDVMPLEITDNGIESRGLHVVKNTTWANPDELAYQVIDHAASPIAKGKPFVVAEVTREGIRFHESMRTTEGSVYVETSSSLDQHSVDLMEERHREQLAAARASAMLASLAKAAMAQAAREVISVSNAVRTTD